MKKTAMELAHGGERKHLGLAWGHERKHLELDARKNPLLAGIAGVLFLPLFYFALMSLLDSSQFVLLNLREIWPYLALMSAGLGVQAGLLVHIHNAARNLGAGAMAASGGISAGSMAACCAHHATDFLPLVGLGAAALFFDKYLAAFLLFGVFSNALGVMWMLGHMRKHGLAGNSEILQMAAKPDWGVMFKPAAIMLGAVWAAYTIRLAAG